MRDELCDRLFDTIGLPIELGVGGHLTGPLKRLKEHGFQPELLDLSRPDNVRVTSGTEIRRLLRANDPSWARFVPAAVAEIISDRLRDQF